MIYVNVKMIGNSIVLLLISLASISCSNTRTTAGQPPEINSENQDPHMAEQTKEIRSNDQYPIIEIWKELSGSVPIRGKSLYFRLYNDGPVEFDYEVRKENPARKPPFFSVSLERMPPTKISEERYSRFKSLAEDLIKSKDIKGEYKPVALTFDVLTKLTILLRENDTTERKIIINDSDLDVLDSHVQKKFPRLLISLIKEIHLIREERVPSGPTQPLANNSMLYQH